MSLSNFYVWGRSTKHFSPTHTDKIKNNISSGARVWARAPERRREEFCLDWTKFIIIFVYDRQIFTRRKLHQCAYPAKILSVAAKEKKIFRGPPQGARQRGQICLFGNLAGNFWLFLFKGRENFLASLTSRFYLTLSEGSGKAKAAAPAEKAKEG